MFDAARDAGNRWVFQELLNEGLEPWNGVRFVAVFGSPDPTHDIDVTGYLDKGLDSLEEHKAYLEGIGRAAADSTRNRIANLASEGGKALGCEHAELVELVPIN